MLFLNFSIYLDKPFTKCYNRLVHKSKDGNKYEKGAPLRESSGGERRYGPSSEIHSRAAHRKSRLRRERPLTRMESPTPQG